MSFPDPSKKYFQRIFNISGLVKPSVEIKKKIWIKNDEIFLYKVCNETSACVLEDMSTYDNILVRDNETLRTFVEFFSLITDEHVLMYEYYAERLQSNKEFGNNINCLEPIIRNNNVMQCNQESKDALERVEQIKHIYDKYIEVINDNAHLKIALKCFYKSYPMLEDSSEMFINAITGMEALYNESSADISYKLAHRAAFLLGLLDDLPHESSEVFENIKKAYNNRSQIIHGNASGDYKLQPVFSYLRLSLVIMIILHSESSKKLIKKDVLNKIDLSMLNLSRQQKLKKEIEKHWEDLHSIVPVTLDKPLTISEQLSHMFTPST